MMNINPVQFFLIGDLHQRFQPIRDFHLRHNTNKAYNYAEKIMLCLGDFGANFFLDEPQGRDAEFKSKLGCYPFIYFVIRGNHEQRPSICMENDPDNWHDEFFCGNRVYVENDYPYIKYALDVPAIYYIDGYKVLTVPGAYSVDKYRRLSLGHQWFPQEQLSEEEMELGRQLLNKNDWSVDLVLSHTCPICYEPTHLFLDMVDQSTVDKTMERYLGEIEYKLDYRAWCWGHFHQYLEYPHTDDARRRLMLFNDAVVDLDNLMSGEELIKL